MLVFISAGITECSWVAAGSSPLLWQQPAGVHKDCETREPQPAGDQQLKIQKSRPPCSPLTTWRASPYGAKLPLPSEAASYNSSSIKVIFVTSSITYFYLLSHCMTYKLQCYFYTMILFRPQIYPAQAASGREMDVTMGLCLICNRKTVGFYFIETHLYLFIFWQ